MINFLPKKTEEDSSGGPVVKNSPINASDTGSIPGPGRFHTPQSNLSLCAVTPELVL